MRRMGRAIVLLAAFVVPSGCGTGDPGQPAPGSISVGARSEDGPKIIKKGAKAARTR
jgi:hypothetical protein